MPTLWSALRAMSRGGNVSGQFYSFDKKRMKGVDTYR